MVLYASYLRCGTVREQKLESMLGESSEDSDQTCCLVQYLRDTAEEDLLLLLR